MSAMMMLIAVTILSRQEASAESFSDAKKISVNTTVSGTTQKGYYDEQDYYKFTVSNAGYVTVNFTNSLQSSSSAYWEVYLYDSSYNEIASADIYGNKTSTNLATIGVKKGTYYIKVQSAAYSSSYSNFSKSTYKVKASYTKSGVWEQEFNESASTATSISLNTIYYGTTRKGYYDEQDYYKLTVSDAGYVTVNFANPLQSSSSAYWKVYLYDSSYEEIASANIYGNTKSTNLATIGVKKGTYYIKVQSAAYSSSYSNFSKSTYKVKASYIKSSVWEQEFNESASTATPISLNTMYYGTTRKGYRDEQDYYKFTVNDTGYVTVNFKNPLQSSSEHYWSVYLYDSSYEEIASANIYGNTKSTNLATIGVKKGTYYIKVDSGAAYSDGSNFSNSTYGIKAVYTKSGAWEQEFNESASTATNISLNTMYYGTTRKGYRDEQDYYKFTVSDAGYVTVNFTNPLQSSSEHYWSVYLYDSSYEEIDSAYIYGNTTSTNLAAIGLQRGTYYIKVDSGAAYSDGSNFSNSTYGIKAIYTKSSVWEKELNENPTTATPINMNMTYYGTTRGGQGYEQDYYKFTVSSKKTYAIGLTTSNLKDGNAYWVMYLYDAQYNAIASADIYGNRTYHAIKAKLPKGTYYVKVQSAYYSSYSDSVYKLKVSSYSSITPKKTSVNGKIAAKSRGFTVKWKKVSKGITGYQIQYSTSKKFTNKTTKTVSKSKTSLKVKKLRANKKYYVRVRTYKTYNINGENVKVYSGWSKVKTVKTKR